VSKSWEIVLVTILLSSIAALMGAGAVEIFLGEKWKRSVLSTQRGAELEAWIQYIETTGRVHTDFTKDFAMNEQGIIYATESPNGRMAKQRFIFRPHSRIVSVSSTAPFMVQHNQEGLAEWVDQQSMTST
jgi:hypothetical protein